MKTNAHGSARRPRLTAQRRRLFDNSPLTAEQRKAVRAALAWCKGIGRVE